MESAQPVRLRRPEPAPAGGGGMAGPGAAEEEPSPATPPREAAEGRPEGSGPGRVRPRAEQADRRRMALGGFPWAPRSLLEVVAVLAALAAIGGLAV